jgi:hypothetical protein
MLLEHEMTKAKDEAPQRLHDVVLLKDHKHEGELCLAGKTITVNTADRNWLYAQRIIAPDAVPAVAE